MDAAILTEACIGALTILVLGIAYGRRLLTLERDFLLTLYIIVFVIYIVLAPAGALADSGPRYAVPYFTVQATAILFFLIPLIVAYRIALRPTATNEPETTLALSRFHYLFPLFLVVSVALFYYIAFKNGLFLRRIGHAQLAEAQSVLNLPTLAFYRGFSEAAPTLAFLSCLTAVTARRTGRTGVFLWHLLGASTLLLGMGAFLFVNNRLQTLLFGLAGFLALHYFGRRREMGASPRLSVVRLAAIGIVAVPIAFAVQVARNIALSGGDQNVADLTTALMEGEVETTPVYWRLNGVDLAAHIADRGFANASWGQSYVEPLAVNLNVLIAPARAEAAKLANRTNVKTILSNDVLGIGEPDNFSSVLTDLYGNFWFLPFPLAGALLGLLFGRCQSALLSPRSAVSLLLAAYAAIYCLEIEKEFATIVQNLPKFALIPLAFALVSPVAVRRGRSHGATLSQV